MCLAVPGRVTALFTEAGMQMGMVDFGGVSREVCVEHIDDLVVGEYVIVHVGYALTKLNEKEANEILDVLKALTNADMDADAPDV